MPPRAAKTKPVLTLDALMGKQPPNSTEAEMALLGAAILDPRVIDECHHLITPDAFFWEAHTAIWAALLATRDKGGDLLLLNERLRDSAQLELAGGTEYLVKLSQETPGTATALHFAKVVASKAKLRRLITAAQQTIHSAYHDPDAEPSELCNAAVAKILDAGKELRGSEDVQFAQAIDLITEDIKVGKPQIWPTNLIPWDDKFSGIMKNGVTTVFGAPNSGKTTLSLQLALSVAMSGVKVRVFSREQGPKRIAATLMQQLCLSPTVAVHDMLNRGTKPTAAEWVAIAQAKKEASHIDFAIIKDRLDAQQIYQRGLLYQRQGVELVIVDYIQNLPPLPDVPRGTPNLDESCNWIQSIAVDLGISVILVSQITAEASRATKSECPTLSDCRGGNSIESISDVAYAVWRPHLNARESHDDNDWASNRADRNKTGVECAKGKYTGRGGIELRFNARTMTFEDPSGQGYLPT